MFRLFKKMLLQLMKKKNNMKNKAYISPQQLECNKLLSLHLDLCNQAFLAKITIIELLVITFYIVFCKPGLFPIILALDCIVFFIIWLYFNITNKIFSQKMASYKLKTKKNCSFNG